MAKTKTPIKPKTTTATDLTTIPTPFPDLTPIIFCFTPQETATLLRSLWPLVVFYAMDIVNQGLVFPPSGLAVGGYQMVNGPVCKKHAADSIVMTELVQFAIIYASAVLEPRLDLEWLAYGVTGIFGLIIT